jgi:hypothetical protein
LICQQYKPSNRKPRTMNTGRKIAVAGATLIVGIVVVSSATHHTSTVTATSRAAKDVTRTAAPVGSHAAPKPATHAATPTADPACTALAASAADANKVFAADGSNLTAVANELGVYTQEVTADETRESNPSTVEDFSTYGFALIGLSEDILSGNSSAVTADKAQDQTDASALASACGIPAGVL